MSACGAPAEPAERAEHLEAIEDAFGLLAKRMPPKELATAHVSALGARRGLGELWKDGGGGGHELIDAAARETGAAKAAAATPQRMRTTEDRVARRAPRAWCNVITRA